jgi:hypothetical protein
MDHIFVIKRNIRWVFLYFVATYLHLIVIDLIVSIDIIDTYKNLFTVNIDLFLRITDDIYQL